MSQRKLNVIFMLWVDPHTILKFFQGRKGNVKWRSSGRGAYLEDCVQWAILETEAFYEWMTLRDYLDWEAGKNWVGSTVPKTSFSILLVKMKGFKTFNRRQGIFKTGKYNKCRITKQTLDLMAINYHGLKSKFQNPGRAVWEKNVQSQRERNKSKWRKNPG